MSTRSQIGVMKRDGTVQAIYCHFDGYPGHVGRTLVDNYASTRKANAIVERGDMSTLNSTLKKSVFYHRDRGEKFAPNAPLVFNDANTFFYNGGRGAEFNYLWVPREKAWRCYFIYGKKEIDLYDANTYMIREFI